MRSKIKANLFLSLVLLLAACGGGGGGDQSSTSTDKYAGTHSYCDDDHTRYRLVLTGSGNGNYSVSATETTYANADCSGDILATYAEPTPSTLTFIETSLATVNAPNLSPSLNIDKYKLNIPQQTATLTGPNVNGNCFNYPRGQICYQLTVSADLVDLGVFSTSGGFYPLFLENGIYINEDGQLYVKE